MSAKPVQVWITRNPKKRRSRRFDFFKFRASDIDFPGADLLDIDDFALALILIPIALLVLFIGLFLGGFLIALVELLLIILISFLRWVWTIVSRKPKMTVAQVGETHWVKESASNFTIEQEKLALESGTDPESLGYKKF